MIVVNAESRQPFRKPLGPAGFEASPDLDEAPRPQDARDGGVMMEPASEQFETPVSDGTTGEVLGRLRASDPIYRAPETDQHCEIAGPPFSLAHSRPGSNLIGGKDDDCTVLGAQRRQIADAKT